MKYYNIPEMWSGESAFILGGGPTLLRCLDGRKLYDHNVIGVNLAYTLGDWVDVCWFGDAKFYWWNKDGLAGFTGLKITYNRGLKHGYNSLRGEDGVHIVARGKGRGIDMRRGRVCWNCSSGGSAINLAAQFGAKRIVLLGYDMRVVGGRKNWKSHSREYTKLDPYDNFLRPYGDIARDARREGIKIVNATPGSALRAFPMTTLSEVLNGNGAR